MHINILWAIPLIIFLIHIIGYWLCHFLLILPCKKGGFSISDYYSANMASPFLTPKVESLVNWIKKRFPQYADSDHHESTVRESVRIVAFFWEILIMERMLFCIFLCIFEILDFFHLIDFSDCSSKEDE
jgi:hypothetical protein